MKLELKHLAPYLPYRINPLKIQYADGVCLLEGLSGGYNVELRHGQLVSTNINIETVKPILRPLSDLFNDKRNPIPINETKHLFGWDYLFYEVYKKKEPFNVYALRWATLNKLFEWNFDVFGLIEAGLAIDINTLTP